MSSKEQQFFLELTIEECFLYYEEAKMNNDEFQELNILLIILGKSLSVYQDYLIFDYFETCQNLCIKLDDSKSYSQLLHLVATVYYNLLEYKTAIIYFKRSAKIALHNSHFEIASLQYCHISKCYIKLNRIEKALQYTHCAKWISERASIKNQLVIMYYSLQYVEITFLLKNYDQSFFYSSFLNDFIENDFFEKEKAMIHLLKAQMASANCLYEEEFYHLKLARKFFFIAGDLQKQLHTIELILNCPTLDKSTSDHANYMRMHFKIVNQIQETYNKTSFRKALSVFNKKEQNTRVNLDAKFEKLFFDNSTALLKNPTHLFVFTFPKNDVRTLQEQSKYFEKLQKTLETILIDENSACGSYYNQFVIAFNELNDTEILTKINFNIQNLTDKHGELIYAHARSSSHTTSMRELYNFAYAQHYYILDNQ